MARKSLDLVLKLADRPEHLVAILFENGAPELGVAFGDPGRVTETSSGVVAPGVILALKMGTDGSRDHVG